MGEEAQQGSVAHPKPAKPDSKKRKPKQENDAGGKKVRPDDKVFWACPFLKRHPQEYRDCQNRRLARLTDVTQHIHRKHLVPIHCPRCGQVFQSDKGRGDHIIQGTCQVRPFSHPGATPDQVVAMRGNPEATVPEAKNQHERIWYGRYAILFDDKAPRPASPYLSVLEGDTAQAMYTVIQSFIKEGHSDRFAQAIAPSDKALPHQFRQLLARLQEHILDPSKQQGTRVTMTPAAGPSGLEYPVTPAPPPGPAQNSPGWPDFDSANLVDPFLADGGQYQFNNLNTMIFDNSTGPPLGEPPVGQQPWPGFPAATHHRP